MNILVVSSRQSRGISRWIPVLLAASFCLTVAVSAQAVTVTETFRYDGTYYPSDALPPAGQSTWDVTLTGSVLPGNIQPNIPTTGVAWFNDDQADGYIMAKNVFTDTMFIAAPRLYEWEYEFTITVNSVGGGKPNNFGLRDEGGVGRQVMLAHSPDGELYYADYYFSGPQDAKLYVVDETHPSLLDGESHTYRVVKDVDTLLDTVEVLFYLDGNLLDTRDYSTFSEDRSSDKGFCLASSSTTGTADWEVDEAYFGPGSTSEPIPGDANRDDVVNDADASILAAHWQQVGNWGDGDFNGDNIVNDLDASILAAHWLQSQEGGSPVPEPSTVVLLLLGGLMAPVLWRRRCVL